MERPMLTMTSAHAHLASDLECHKLNWTVTIRSMAVTDVPEQRIGEDEPELFVSVP